MYSTLFLLLLIAFYLLYNGSSRIKATNKIHLLNVLRQKPRLCRTISLSVVLVVSFLFIEQLGLGAGIFGLVVALMGVASLVIILTPFYYVRIQHVVVLYLFLVAFEIFIR